MPDIKEADSSLYPKGSEAARQSVERGRGKAKEKKKKKKKKGVEGKVAGRM